MLYAGDLNAIQDAAAALSDLAQNLRVGTLAVGEAGLQLIRFGPLDLRLTGAYRTDGLIRALGGMYLGAFTTAQRDAIAAGSRPYGLAILNTSNNRWELNIGTDPAPVWVGIGASSVTSGTLAARPAASPQNNNTWYFATDASGGTLYFSNGAVWTQASKGLTALPVVHGAVMHDPLTGTDKFTMSLAGTLATRPSAGSVAVGVNYFATDVNGGTLYRSDGSIWTAITIGLNNQFQPYQFAESAANRDPGAGSNVWADYGSPYNCAITIAVTGTYKVSFGARGVGSGAASSSRAGLSVNGAAPSTYSLNFGSSDSNNSDLTTVMALNAGDILRLYHQDSDATRPIGTDTRWLMAERIG